ncbi:ABC transporter substrate-binding protein [Acidiphilium sp. AL]|uniref:ABC transporter substrate-binding protein n=1 Tax=Acidiphilium iwatense TaxID=768198 RepID=A0ABS9DYP2_9PROT|nr:MULTISPECIES: ABC transporter substrate-binding protein [Acidiphilium]MCF3946915.1 ABC transporter substrate-binding protein [Acidiphilium iwatense]MCU4159780.1 ABC transporter substrate-binding protein [Acidiphilium sp. AL]
MTASRKILLASLTAATMIGGLGAAYAAKPRVVIGYENNGADPYMVTQSLGLFQKTIPANVTLKFFASGPAAMSALASNSLQFMCGLGVPPFVAGISQGLPLAIVFNQERYTTAAGIVVRPGKGIKTVADLKGRKIAIAEGSQSSFELATFLAEAGVPFGSVRQLNMSPPEMRVAWTTKSIDAAIVWDPVFDALRGLGGRVLKTDAELPPDASSYNICIADTKWVAAHPKLATDFVRALDQGVTYTKQHPKKALAIMAKAAGVTLPVAKSELAGYQIFSAKDQTTQNVLGSGSNVANSATTKTLENTAKVLLKIGRITSLPKNPAEAVEPRFAAAAQ